MLRRERFLRQLDICPPEKLAFPITVIGAGAIGSATVLTLAKMGCSDITVWDHDVLEEHNIPNQICKPSCVGRPKVKALKELVVELTEVEISARNEKYRGQRVDGVIITAVDNMAARELIWERIKLNPSVPLFIDPRMGGEVARIYCIRPSSPDDIALYEQNLYPEDEAEQLPCSARSIIYCPTMIAAIITLQMKQLALGHPILREVLVDASTLQPLCPHERPPGPLLFRHSQLE